MSSDSLVQKIAGYIDAIQNFGDVLPQEKKSIYTLIIPVIIREILFGFNAMSSHPTEPSDGAK